MTNSDHAAKKPVEKPLTTQPEAFTPEAASDAGIFQTMQRAINKPNNQTLNPKTILQLQRTIGNRATQKFLQRPRTAPTIQRNIYLANEDDNIYKDSNDDASEYAYIYMYSKYPIFIPYAAIDNLRNVQGLGGLQVGNIQEYFIQNIEHEIKQNSQLGQNIKAALGGTYLYNKNSTKIEPADFGNKATASIISAAFLNGAKSYRTGGGSRLPSPTGGALVYTPEPIVGDQRLFVLNELGIPPEKHANYAQLSIQATTNEKVFELVANSANESDTNGYVHRNSFKNIGIAYFTEAAALRSANSRITVDGTRHMQDNDFLNMNDPLKLQQIQTSFNNLVAPIQDTGWVPGTKLTAVDRGAGQAKAMNNWNAMGAAAYANKVLGKNYDLNQNWEWLHVQGAQIGGATVGGNLVPGLYVANSAMIPFESMVQKWAEADPKNFAASFRATNIIDGVFAQGIQIWIVARGHKILHDLDATLLATFDPLTGKLVDKFANEMIKRNIDQNTRKEEFY